MMRQRRLSQSLYNEVPGKWIRCNVNPARKEVGDCVIRAIAVALNRPWTDIHDDLCALSGEEYDMPNSDAVWGKYLYMMGFEPFLLPQSCPRCTTVKQFCLYYPKGIYIIGTGSHAVAVVDGNYYDSWDCGSEVPSFFWRIR